MKLRKFCLALTLCSALPLASSAFAMDDGSSKPASKTAKSPFLTQTDCFGGAGDYDSWLKTLPSERMGQALPVE